jgi:hypothetical protein
MNMHDRMESIADVYVAGGLGADERREADGHAEGCASCSALLRDAKEFAAWTRGAIAADAPPADLEDRVLARFRAAGQAKKRRFPVGKRIFKVTGSIAAAAALVFLGNAFSGQHRDLDLTYGMESFNAVNPSFAIEAAMDKGVGFLKSREGPAGPPPAGSELAFFFKRDLGQDELNRAQHWGYTPENLRLDDAIGQLKDVNGLPKLQAESQRKADASALAAGFGGGAGGRNGGDIAGKRGAAPMSPAPEKLGEMAALGMNRGDDKAGESLERRQNQVVRGGGTRVVESPPVQDTRKVIRTGDVSLEVESYEAAYAKLSDLVAIEKGQIANASTQKLANGKVRATVTIRILPERFEAFLSKLKEFGTIQNQTMGSQDVTKAYLDLETRLKSKEILAERLRKLLAEAKGTVKELMEVEVQLGNTNEAIEQIKGEIKYYDNQIGMSTITLRISEKDLGQPFEYVQSLQANIAFMAKDPDEAYVKAQKEITDAGGQVVDSRMVRQSDGSATGTIRARVDAEKFPALREALKKLGTVTTDTVNQQKTARGGNEGTPKVDAPLRKEMAVIDLTIASPTQFVTRRSQILVETGEVESAYQNARRAAEAAGGRIVDGSLTGRSDGMSATLRVQIDADKFGGLVDSFKSAGKVKNANVNVILPVYPSDTQPLLKERAEIEFALTSPPQLIGEEHGILKTVRDTFANSWTGLLWSIEKLFVGVSLAGPWIALLAAAWLLWRRARRKKAAQAAPAK